MMLEGNIIAGEYDSTLNEFSLHRVKRFETESILKEKQVNHIHDYLKKNQHVEDGQIISLYDQLLVPLSQNEVTQLIEDLEKVKLMFH
jgi:hypothetical protein